MATFRIGFTVIELLIVVVVLVLLAGIGSAGYRGIATRAKNADTAEVVSKYIDALIMYHAKYGKYPDGNADFKTCLGVGYPAGKCWKGEISENAAFTNELNKIYGKGFPVTSNASLGLRGAWYKAAGSGLTVTLDGQPEDFVVYSVDGDNTKCPIGPLASDNGDTNVFTYSSVPPASGQTHPKNTGYVGDPVQCWVPLSVIK